MLKKLEYQKNNKTASGPKLICKNINSQKIIEDYQKSYVNTKVNDFKSFMNPTGKYYNY